MLMRAKLTHLIRSNPSSSGPERGSDSISRAISWLLIFGPAVGQSVFNVTIDGATEIADIRAGAGARYVWPHPLAAGRHRLEIFKRSEAAKGHVAFRGVELAAGTKAWAPPALEYRLKMAFFGDSITAGACNEDGATDQWEDFRTHNYALSWAHLTAERLRLTIARWHTVAWV